MTRSPSHRTAVAMIAAVAMLLVGACGRSGREPGVSRPAASQPVRTDLPSSIELVARGATEVSLRTKLPLTVSRFEPAERDLRLLTFGLAEFAPLDDGRRVRLAVDLAGIYDGPGRYEFGAATTGSQLSAAFLHVVKLRDPAGPLDEANVESTMSFDRILAPCAVEIDDGERAGRLSCPRLGATDGSEIDLELGWEAG